MKKLICLLMSFILMTGCRQSLPAEYTFYENFQAEKEGVEITPVSTEKYTDITDKDATAVIAQKAGLKNLTDHSVYTTKSSAVVNLYFRNNSGHEDVQNALDYAFETFWNGKVHTDDLLPYEDWQYSHKIKELTVQIFCEGTAAVQEIYKFDKLTDSGEKLYEKTRTVNNDVLFLGTYIYIGDLLKGSQEQLDRYVNIDSIAGQSVHTALRQPLDKDRLTVELLTEERQIAPEKLNSIYDAVYERYSFIHENIVIRLYVADKGIYYEYTGHIQLPEE